ncbi:DUF6384 family protein [Roseibium aggregatum]|uniref:Uncharacterized protein n=1 Tax=Roseibium aggregatum TaxID=187304 RepID=A0A926NZ45_9HYPH|nr:DUF6384 family protein [Roseibium aggregatum]MBD1548054.1 hypothetical protein [Roseibium aggregatum]
MADKADAPLDDLMMAMDVVDTLRHDEDLVAKELGAEDRDKRMIARLREVYASQGIEVPDHILQAGVEGLKEDRFVYAPPSAGAMRLLARIYVTRMIWSKWLGGLVLACVILVAGWQFLVVAPRERAAAALQVELTREIPETLTSLSQRIAGLNPEKTALEEAGRLESAGRTAAEDKNIEAARKAVADLRTLASDLAAVYDVRIVSRPGTPTGVTRIPDANPNAKNYYLIVEAIGPDGKAVERTVKSEEDGKEKTVTIWAQRVPESTFEKVRKDKEADGIVQDNLLGTKVRGKLGVDWKDAVEKGAITTW